jgi:hypothetical protein
MVAICDLLVICPDVGGSISSSPPSAPISRRNRAEEHHENNVFKVRALVDGVLSELGNSDRRFFAKVRLRGKRKCRPYKLT